MGIAYGLRNKVALQASSIRDDYRLINSRWPMKDRNWTISAHVQTSISAQQTISKEPASTKVFH